MKLLDLISKLVKGVQKSAFDPSVFNDPLAEKTMWTPQARGGANFKTRTLKVISSSELRYVGSVSGKLFAIFFMVFPLIFITVGIVTLRSIGFQPWLLVFILFPLLFTGVGIYLLQKAMVVFTLDKGYGYFYKGKKVNNSSLNPEKKNSSFKLATIKALQIIPEHVRSKNSSYTSYEINFVFEDGSRYNLVDHGRQKSIEKDALVISNFLNIPIWNKVLGTTYNPNKSIESDSYDSLEPEQPKENSYETEYTLFAQKKSKKYSKSSTDNLDAPYDSTKPREM